MYLWRTFYSQILSVRYFLFTDTLSVNNFFLIPFKPKYILLLSTGLRLPVYNACRFCLKFWYWRFCLREFVISFLWNSKFMVDFALRDYVVRDFVNGELWPARILSLSWSFALPDWKTIYTFNNFLSTPTSKFWVLTFSTH